jgi:Rieske Fe-S protein
MEASLEDEMHSLETCDVDRRGFLRNCSIIAAAALAAGATGARAEQLAMRWTRPLAAGAREVTYPLPVADGVEVDRDHSVLLTRYQGRIYAFSMICPHQRAAVKWLADKQMFQCTKHKSKYSGAGSYISGRATRSLDRHPVKIVNGLVVVDETVLLKEDENQAVWKAAVAQV